MAGMSNIGPALKSGVEAGSIMTFTPWRAGKAKKLKQKEWDLTMKSQPAKPVPKVNYDPTETQTAELDEEAKRRRAGRRVPTVLDNASSSGDTLG